MLRRYVFFLSYSFLFAEELLVGFVGGGGPMNYILNNV